MVLTISALAALLFHWGILQRIVAAFAWVLRKTVGIGGALGIGAAVHIFVGMVEAPLLVRPYLKTMSRGELFAFGPLIVKHRLTLKYDAKSVTMPGTAAAGADPCAGVK